MEAIFLKLLNMSIAASWLVVAVVLLRLVFKKAPKIVSLILWALVGIRLILPFSLESNYSLVPNTQAFTQGITVSQSQSIGNNLPSVNNPTVDNPIVDIPSVDTPGIDNPSIDTPPVNTPTTDTPVIDNPATTPPQQATPNTNTPSTSPSDMADEGEGRSLSDVFTTVASFVWLGGLAAMLFYALVSYIRVRLKVREAAKLEGNIMVCDRIASPFILGIVRPKIYMPSTLNVEDVHYVLAHENAHLKRRDHLWKPLGFFLLSVYWFNPVLWVAYILLCRDIELACDEKVIKSLGTKAKKPYSTALVNCSVSHKVITVCPLAFGEVGVKRRVKTVLNYKKPAFWIIIVAIIAIIAVAVCFLTIRPSDTSSDTTTTTTNSDTTTTTKPNDDTPKYPGVRYQKAYRTQYYSGVAPTKTTHIYVYDEKDQLIQESAYDENGTLTAECKYQYDENGTKVYYSAYVSHWAPGEFYFGETKYDKHGNITYNSISGAEDTSSTQRYRYEYEYDDAGNLTAETCYSSVDSGANEFIVHKKEYNKDGNVVLAHHYQDMEVIIQYQYDANGNLILELSHYPDGEFDCKYEYEYDKNGNLLVKVYYSEPDTMYWKEVYEYDEKGNRTKFTNYDSNGNVTVELTTVYKYKENGDIETETVYNRDGSVFYELTYSDFYYNNDNREFEIAYRKISSTKYRMGELWRFYEQEYNDKGQLVKETNLTSSSEIKDQTVYEYDENGTLVHETEYNSKNWKYENTYDKHGNVLTATAHNEKGERQYTNQYSYEYEYYPSGTLSHERQYLVHEDFDGGRYLIGKIDYNQDGNPVYSEFHGDASSVNTYEYDEKGRLIKEFRDSSFSTGDTSTIEYEYDANGNVSVEAHTNTISEGGAWTDRLKFKIVYEYDQYGNLIKQTDYDENGEVDYIQTYEYEYGEDGAIKTKTDYFDGELSGITTYENPFKIYK